jgi:hypothetical protein
MNYPLMLGVLGKPDILVEVKLIPSALQVLSHVTLIRSVQWIPANNVVVGTANPT